jgi:hypothetical protein
MRGDKNVGNMQIIINFHFFKYKMWLAYNVNTPIEQNERVQHNGPLLWSVIVLMVT